MQGIIRSMEEKDRGQVLEMMRVFYASPAVLTNGSQEIFEADINACLSDNPYLEGYIFENIGFGLAQGYRDSINNKNAYVRENLTYAYYLCLIYYRAFLMISIFDLRHSKVS